MSDDNARRLDFSDVALYGVTPSIKDGARLLALAERVLAGGADAIQLRCRELSDRDLVELGKKMKALCRRSGALFIINNRPDIALAVDADGIHIGHEDLPISFVRDLVGHRRIVGVSTHSLPEAIEAQKGGADYVSCGPIWATPTKPDYQPVGLNLIGLYRAALRIPTAVIGGVDETTIDEIVAAGARCVAVVRALFGDAEPEHAARRFKEKIKANRPKIQV